MLKKDDIKLGLVLGFIVPVVGIFVLYLIKFRVFSLQDYFLLVSREKSVLSGLISLALIANAVIFTVFINQQKDKTARGIFIATCIYALITLGVKFLG